MARNLIHLEGVTRIVRSGDKDQAILADVNLDIRAGEFVAIVGASGSGKSTLMNILGCLDRPTSGCYQFDGEYVGSLPPDELARLRRTRIGFVFQQYHLIPYLRAIDNVGLPSVYTNVEAHERDSSAARLLRRLGLSDCASLLPKKLSGGQQQRVSIARALMNNCAVILADEPTGALDTSSGIEVMRFLRELNDAGRTLIVVTHDKAVAAQADRVIEISGGRIVADRAPTDRSPEKSVDETQRDRERTDHANASSNELELQIEGSRISSTSCATEDRSAPGLHIWLVILRMAFASLKAHRMQSALTILGIAIGVGILGVTTAAGAASTKKILGEFARFDTHSIFTYYEGPQENFPKSPPPSLTADDAEAITNTEHIDKASLHKSTQAVLRYGHAEITVMAHAIYESYLDIHDFSLVEGVSLNGDHTKRAAQVVVIDPRVRQKLFQPTEDPCGKIIMINETPFKVIGVGKTLKSPSFERQASIWLPYTTAVTRMSGSTGDTDLIARYRPDSPANFAASDVSRILAQRHNGAKFTSFDVSEYGKAEAHTQSVQSAFQMFIAFSTLIIGGVGIMNVMIVSITNRTSEIGIRMAIGARAVDIRRQFMAEALMLCIAGGVLGAALAYGLAAVLPRLVPELEMTLSLTTVFSGVACSTLIGLLFGFFPARKASRLQPVDALASA